MTITVDSEFKNLIPPLTDEERTSLETSVKADGCRDALVVWSEGDVLLDGHNRHAICEANGLGYQVKKIDLEDRKAAVNWIINNQLGRRNLTPEQASYLRGQRYNREKKPFGGQPANEGWKVRDGLGVQNEHADGQKTGEKLASEYKVGEGTIRRDGKFSAAVDKLAEAHGPELKRKILQRDSHIPKKAVIAAAQEETPERQLEVLETPSKASSNGKASESKRSKHVANDRYSVEERAEQILPLAEEGYRADQIGDKIGVAEGYVRKIARQFDITLPDEAMGNTCTGSPMMAVMACW